MKTYLAAKYPIIFCSFLKGLLSFFQKLWVSSFLPWKLEFATARQHLCFVLRWKKMCLKLPSPPHSIFAMYFNERKYVSASYRLEIVHYNNWKYWISSLIITGSIDLLPIITSRFAAGCKPASRPQNRGERLRALKTKMLGHWTKLMLQWYCRLCRWSDISRLRVQSRVWPCI